MVEGALSERGQQPSNVQVSLLDTKGGVTVRLEDEDGIFMEIPPPEREVPTDGTGSPRVSKEETEREGGTGTSPREEELNTMTTTTAELRTAHDRITKLEDEVSVLQGELGRALACSHLVEGLENELSSLRAEFGSMKTHYEDQLAVEKANSKIGISNNTVTYL